MNEFHRKNKEGMQVVMPILKESIFKYAEKHFKDEEQFNNFVLSACVNFLGNMVYQASGDDLDKFEGLSHVTVRNLVSWFATTIANEKRKKDTH